MKLIQIRLIDLDAVRPEEFDWSSPGGGIFLQERKKYEKFSLSESNSKQFKNIQLRTLIFQSVNFFNFSQQWKVNLKKLII